MKAKLIVLLMLMNVSVISHAADKTEDLRVTTKGESLIFEPSELTVSPAKKVRLTFKNSASVASGLQHNWVLVKTGKAEAVANASMSAGLEKGWLQESPDILAHTKLLGPGEEQAILFTAPKEKGDYPFICTFPGHSMTMKGLLHVK